MKFFFLLLLAIPLFSFSQTPDETMIYNYCRVGFKTQISQGLDPAKQGYHIIHMGHFTRDSLFCHFYSLMKKNSDSDVVATIFIVGNTKNESDYSKADFFCIPGWKSSDAFRNQCFADLETQYASHHGKYLAVIYFLEFGYVKVWQEFSNHMMHH
jgi:hypothetical protein